MSLLIIFQVFLCLFHAISYAQSPFIDGSEEKLLELLDKVERELKVFVYSLDVIQGLRRCDMKYGGFTPVNNPATRSNFQQELDMPLFMQNHKTIRTLNPEEADYFLIVHEWICLRIGNEDTHYIVPEKAEKYYHEHVLPLQQQKQQQGRRSLRNNIPNHWTGEKIAQEHVWPIMHHVVSAYPYFNRSQGHDHFMMNLLDNGFQCGGGHIQSKSPTIIPIFELLENVTFIGNNGYSYEHDEGIAQFEHGYGKRCFDGKKDITIPQAHSWYQDQELSDEKRIQQAQLPLRDGNIYFTGDVDIAQGSDCSPDARVRMASAISRLDNEINQNRNEGAVLEQLRETRRHIQFQAGQTQTSYFSLCPSRNACWSVRLYDALNHDSIPVILADQMIAPFERFLNWSTFTVKYITRNSTFEEHYIDDLTRFGNEARVFAAAQQQQQPQIVAPDSGAHAYEKLPFVAKKLSAIRQVAPWLSFACPALAKRCAYRLVLAELWCKTKKGREHAACKRKSSQIAWREYL